MQFNPYLVPVVCDKIEDMAPLAQQMREAALKDTDKIESYHASDSIPEATKRSGELISESDFLSSGHLRFIKYRDRRNANICLTLREDETKKEWNLSISHATNEGPIRVRDDLAEMIATAMLGEGYTEVEPKAIWKTVRHFVKDHK